MGKLVITDEDGKPRKVTAIPEGYVYDPTYKGTPGVKYYKKGTQRSTPVRTGTTKKPYPTKSRIGTGGGKARVVVPKPAVTVTPDANTEYVYMEDAVPTKPPSRVTVPVDNPAAAFFGENTFDPANRHAIGLAQYPSRTVSYTHLTLPT